MEEKKSFWRELLPHAVWSAIEEIIKRLAAPVGGGALITILVAAWERAKSVSPDWYFIAVLFVVSSVLFYVAIRSRPIKKAEIAGVLDELLAAKKVARESSPNIALTLSVPAPPLREVSSTTQIQEIDGELYRLATAPRTMSWELLRDLCKVSGRPGDAVVDCDVLVEMYLVNLSKQQKYIREIRLSAEIAGVRTNFEMMRDLRANDINNRKYEYALESSGDFYAPDEPLKLLMPQIPLSLTPEQPTEGWIRFTAKEINPDNIDRKTWQVMVVDSTGTEHPITKVSQRPLVGKVGLRQG